MEDELNQLRNELNDFKEKRINEMYASMEKTKSHLSWLFGIIGAILAIGGAIGAIQINNWVANEVDSKVELVVPPIVKHKVDSTVKAYIQGEVNEIASSLVNKHLKDKTDTLNMQIAGIQGKLRSLQKTRKSLEDQHSQLSNLMKLYQDQKVNFATQDDIFDLSADLIGSNSNLDSLRLMVKNLQLQIQNDFDSLYSEQVIWVKQDTPVKVYNDLYIHIKDINAGTQIRGFGTKKSEDSKFVYQEEGYEVDRVITSSGNKYRIKIYVLINGQLGKDWAGLKVMKY